MKLKRLPLNAAIVAALAVGAGAYAEQGNNYGKNKSGVEIDKEVNVDIEVEHRGYIQTLGLVLVDSSATSISDVNQKTQGNQVNNGFDTENNAIATGDALRSASGNIGLNVAAGDNNMQQNSTAISHIESPSNGAVDLQAGYSETIHHSSNSNSSFDHDRQRASAKARSNDGSVSHSHAKANTLEASGTYDHTQNESSSSTTTIDVPVEGNIGYKTGAGSHSAKAMELPLKKGELSHDQEAGWFTYKDADLEAVKRKGEAGDFTETDTTSTYSSTDINADFEVSSAKAESSSFEKNWSSSSSKSSSSSTSIHKDAHEESSYDYHEFAMVDAELVFGAALDAETFSSQTAYNNTTNNYGATNTAVLNGNVGQNASGNVGVNIVAGNSNAQANQLAIAAGNNAVMALATASSDQYTGGNYTDNASNKVLKEVSHSTIKLNQVGQATGTYEGLSDQWGDVYPDMWEGGTLAEGHPCTNCDFWGHFDLDGHADGAQDAPEDHPAHAPGGALLFKEAGDISLGGIKLVGSAKTLTWGYVGHSNNALIGDNALRGATGNIGINVAAGTNNLQGNALAIASVTNGNGNGAPPPNGNGGNGEM